MKKIIFSLILFTNIVFITDVFSQPNPNSLYLELLGNGGLYSVNYDRLFTENFGGRIGFMYISSLDFIIVSAEDFVLFPVLLNYFVGNRHKLELGAGVIFVSVKSVGAFGFKSNSGGSNIVGTAVIGYRYQNPDGGFLFRIGFTPMINSEGIEPWGGISFGFSF